MYIYIYVCIYAIPVENKNGDERVDFLKWKLVKFQWEQLHEKLGTSHGKKIFWIYKRTVDCSNIEINNANNFMTPYDGTDLAAVERERTLATG